MSHTWANSCTVCHKNSGGSPQLAPLKYTTSTNGAAIAAMEVRKGALHTSTLPSCRRNLPAPPINLARPSTPWMRCRSSSSDHDARLKTCAPYSLASLPDTSLGSLSAMVHHTNKGGPQVLPKYSALPRPRPRWFGNPLPSSRHRQACQWRNRLVRHHTLSTCGPNPS